MLSISEQVHLQSEQETACLIQSIFDPQYAALSLLMCHEIYGGLCADLAVTDVLLEAFKSQVRVIKIRIHSRMPQTRDNLLHDFKKQMS